MIWSGVRYWSIHHMRFFSGVQPKSLTAKSTRITKYEILQDVDHFSANISKVQTAKNEEGPLHISRTMVRCFCLRFSYPKAIKLKLKSKKFWNTPNVI